MSVCKYTAEQAEILEAILNGAKELPVEGQNLLLMIAKGMAFSRDCLMKRECDEMEQETGKDRFA